MRVNISSAALAAVLLGTSPFVSAQQVLYETTGKVPLGAYGHQLVGLDDLDGDATPDIAVAAPWAAVSGSYRGEVSIISGRTGAQLSVYRGSVDLERFGWALAALGDVDADGVPDLAVAALGTARVHILSLGKGVVLHTLLKPAAGYGWFGWSLAGPGDLNGDGVGDLAVSFTDGGFPPLARVIIYSGSDGSLLRTHVGSTQGFGRALAAAGDIDGDGVGDLLVGEPGTLPERVHAFSGASGGLLFSIASPDVQVADFGQGLAGGRDVDGDGVPDVAVGAPRTGGTVSGTFLEKGRALIYSGATQVLLHDVIGLHPHKRLGWSVALPGDFSGDGLSDFAVGTSVYLESPGQAFVYSGSSGQRLVSLTDPENSPTAVFGNVQSVGDLDCDGLADLLIGAYGSSVHGKAQVGRMYAWRQTRAGTRGYCTATVSAQGCAPELYWSGEPSISAPSGFHVVASGVPAPSLGLFAYSRTGPASKPFLGGTLCVQAPLLRIPAAPLSTWAPCGTSIGIDFNAWIASGGDPGLLPGVDVWLQAVARDPFGAGGVSLSEGLTFRVGP